MQGLTYARRTMYIMRGISGSGKSTAVYELAEKIDGLRWCSADAWFDFFGKKWRWQDLNKAHGYSQGLAFAHCYAGYPVVIDNTNTSEEEVAPYLTLARVFRYNVQYVDVGGTDFEGVFDCYVRGVHDVEKHTIQKQAERLKQFRRERPGNTLDEVLEELDGIRPE